MTRRRPCRTANHTTTLTGKHQLTVPAAVCRAKGFKSGDRFAVYPKGREEFVAVLQRPSRLLDFAGDLQHHDDRTLVLWESFLEERFRSGDDPAVDAAHVTVWQGLERWLLAHLGGIERIMTTWEDEYDRDVWATFLRQQGYTPLPPAAFIKEVRQP
jgi:bifunctional DNA-binding transcriptional regulator/antitoxin component of YhaV-PrlF toxin-antitoxin module